MIDKFLVLGIAFLVGVLIAIWDFDVDHDQFKRGFCVGLETGTGIDQQECMDDFDK